jgi:hypothetical protein
MFAILGGGIAYFADRLGRHLGKKRLSWLGLRPRHTAELLTFAGGAIVPVFTVLLVIALSAPVREWFVNGPKLLQERDDAYKDLAKGKLELVALRNSTDVLKLSNQKLITSNENLTSEQRNLDSQAKTAKSLLETRSSELQAKTVQLSQDNALLTKDRQQYNTVHKQLLVVQNQMEPVRKKLDATQQQLDKKQGDVDKLQMTFSSLSDNFAHLKKSYDLLKIDEQKAVEDVKKDDAQVKKDDDQMAALDEEISAKENELKATTLELKLATNNLESVKHQRDDNAALFGVTRLRPVNFNINDELGRISVPAGTTPEQATRIVDELIQMASKTAKGRGALTNGSGLEAGLVDLPDKTGDSIIPAAQERAAAVSHISNMKEPLLIVARAFYNTVEGEFVPLNLFVYADPLVYRRNEPIAETVVQGSEDDQQIFQQIAEFIGDKVRTRVRTDKKLIAVSGGEASYGEIPQGEVYSLVEKIHNWGKSARIIAMAGQDTRAGDSLVLKFDLRQ